VQVFEEPQVPSSRATVLIADDIAAWRVRVREILCSRPECQIVGEASDGIETVQRVAELKPDLVLLDIGMPVLNGLQAAPQIQWAPPHSKIVFVTQESDADIRRAAIDAGALGYVLKSNAASELVPTITAVLHNGHTLRQADALLES